MRPTTAALVSRHRSDVVGCAQPSESSARRIACPYRAVLASDATPRCASMASADRQMIGDATLAHDAVGQGLSELPFMREGKHWGGLEEGGGVGKGGFSDPGGRPQWWATGFRAASPRPAR